MAEVLFYHLERTRAEDVVPTLLERSLSRGWRVVLHLGDSEAVRRWDDHLWTFRDDSFLPHGAGEPDPLEPVWLTASADVPPQTDVLMSLVPERFKTDGLSALTRAILLFDSAAAEAARGAWKAVKAAGLEATYWRQGAGGKWEKAG